MRRRMLAVLGLSCCAVGAVEASAGLIVADSFDGYTAGATLAGNNGGSNGTANWTSAWAVNASSVEVIGGGLSYSNGAVQVNGGSSAVAIKNAANNNGVATRTFDSVSGTVYFSLVMELSAGFEASDFVSFYLGQNVGETNAGQMGLLDTSNTQLHARITPGAAGSRVTVSTGSSGSAGSTYFLVGRLSTDGPAVNSNYDRMELFLNPSTLSQPEASATVNLDMGLSSLTRFGIRTVNLDTNDEYRFDELRIGTAWEDVVPVPEPAALGVLALGGLLALGGRAGAAGGAGRVKTNRPLDNTDVPAVTGATSAPSAGHHPTGRFSTISTPGRRYRCGRRRLHGRPGRLGSASGSGLRGWAGGGVEVGVFGAEGGELKGA